MARSKPSLEKNIKGLRRMAKEYHCEKNPLFMTAVEQYIVQQQIIDMIRKELGDGEVTVSKEYVKSRENIYAHPLIKELPKHSDSANKTAALIIDIIKTVGRKDPESDGFEEFIDERDDL